MISKIIPKSGLQVLLILGYLTSPLILIFFINFFSVNVPFWDQWQLVPLFKKVALGSATFQDFFVQHNEHRIFFPRLIITPLAFASGWNIKYELGVNFLLAMITFIALCYLSIKETETPDKKVHLINIFTSIVIFSTVQYENWLWGFQIAWFLINCCLVLCIFSLSSATGLVWLRFFIGAVFCIIASFSSVHGLLVWLAAIPSLMSFCSDFDRRKKLSCILAWLSMFASSCIIYFWDYQKPLDSPDIFFSLKNPLIAIGYFLNLLGRSLIKSEIFSPIFGLLLFSTFIFFIYFWLKKIGSSFFKDAASWISLGTFTILFALVTTIGRSGFGVNQARASRYTTISILLVIAVVHLLRLVVYSHRLVRSSWSIGYLAIGGALTFTIISASIQAYEEAADVSLGMKYGRACLEVVNYIKQLPNKRCLKNLFYDTEQVIELSQDLNQLGFRDIVSNVPLVSEPLADYGAVEIPKTITMPQRIEKNCLNCGPLTVVGWAILPDRIKPAESVFLSLGSESSTFFAYAYVNVQSADIAVALKSNQYSTVRWIVNHPSNLLPSGEQLIKAWVYDPDNKQFVKLKGEPKITVN